MAQFYSNMVRSDWIQQRQKAAFFPPELTFLAVRTDEPFVTGVGLDVSRQLVRSEKQNINSLAK